ncbi:MAG: RNA-binding protein [Bdellovibrionales bacterium]|nr:RNA-binding protein [Bdellovibrionales bacterium]
MGKKLYVGNLPFSATDQSLQELFSQCGNVESAKIIMDRDSGRSKGFGFVEMSSDAEAEAAISKLNGQDFDGRAMNVSEARPMAPREGGGGGRGGFGGGGGGGGGRGGFGGGGGGGGGRGGFGGGGGGGGRGRY